VGVDDFLMAFSFRHLPVLNERDATANAEQLQEVLRKLSEVPTPAETTKANTTAISEILAVLRAG
jgi:hypothetical protein